MAELLEQELNSWDWACFCLGEEKANNAKTSSPWLINIPKNDTSYRNHKELC